YLRCYSSRAFVRCTAVAIWLVYAESLAAFYNELNTLCASEVAMSTVQEFLTQTVTENPVVLFMKGSAQFPQCGFSGKAIQLLRASGVKQLVTVNVLEDEEVRQGIKEFSNWPTIPQLYIKGEFIGGSDIMTEMHESGELKQLLDEA